MWLSLLEGASSQALKPIYLPLPTQKRFLSLAACFEVSEALIKYQTVQLPGCAVQVSRLIPRHSSQKPATASHSQPRAPLKSTTSTKAQGLCLPTECASHQGCPLNTAARPSIRPHRLQPASGSPASLETRQAALPSSGSETIAAGVAP